MPKRILLDEFRLCIFVDHSTGEHTCRAIYRHVQRERFMVGLRSAFRELFRRIPFHQHIHVKVSR